jgi:capsular exopolysaccharide synthesis family protein
MLQQNQSTSSDRSSLSTPDFSSPGELLDSFVHFLRQQYLIILFSTLSLILLGGGYLIVARPSYTAVATMLFDSRKTQFLKQQPSENDGPIDTASVDSQVRVLESDNVALAVIKKLQLTEDPEFSKDTEGGAASAYERMRGALAAFKTRLTVKRDALSYVIEVSFRSFDPEKAAQIANATVDAYLVDELDAKYQSTLRASTWLEGRIRDLRDQASGAEQAVVDYEQANNIVDTDSGKEGKEGKTASEQRVAELNTQLLVAQAQVAEARAKMDRIQAVLTSNSAGAVDATVTDTLKNDVVTRLRSQYLDLASKAQDWAARYGKDHLAVVNLRNQMTEINAAILDEIKQIAGTYRSDFEVAKQHADEVQKAYDAAVLQTQENNQAKVVLNDLKSKARTYRELYENFLQRYMESVQQQSFPITEARLISPALRPLEKSNPKTLLTLAISACAGIILGFAIGVFRDLWDRVFRTTEQAEKLLHVPCITLVPALKDAGPAPRWFEERRRKLVSLLAAAAPRGSTAAKFDPIPGTKVSNAASTESEPAALSSLEHSGPRHTESETAVLSSLELSSSAHTESELAWSIESLSWPFTGNEVLPLGDAKVSSPPLTEELNGSSSNALYLPNVSKGEGAIAPTKAVEPRILAHDDNVLWGAVDAPFSRFAESLRVLKVAIDLSELVRSNKVIGFTSSLPNEGKSTLAAAAALLIAQTGARTILVDCDLRNPSLTQALAPSAQAGLVEVISGKAPIEDVLWQSDPKTNLSFLPAVMKSRVAHTNEILASAATKRLFDELGKLYEYIIVDLSPLAPVVDVRTTTHFVDSYICVIEWGHTKIDVVKKALADAPGVYQNLIGTVLNKVNINKLGRYDAHRGKYYRNKHYARYGYGE